MVGESGTCRVNFKSVFYSDSTRILMVGALVYLPCMLLSTTFGGDTVTRSLGAWYWLQDPFYIVSTNPISWVFGPLHYYSNAFFLTFIPDPNVAPRLAATFFAWICVLPLYGITRRFFGRDAALISTLSFPFFTLFTHLAVSANSESLSVFLLMSSLALLVRWVDSAKTSSLVLSAACITLGCAVRYDLWPLIPALLWIVFSHSRSMTSKTLNVLLYLSISLIFPLSWVLGHVVVQGDPFLFLEQARGLNQIALAHDEYDIREILYKLAFVPGVLLVSLTPLAALLSLYGLVQSLKIRRFSVLHLPALLYTVWFIWTFVITRSSLLFARYTVLFGVFAVIFLGYGVTELLRRLKRKASVRLVALLFGSLIVGNLALAQFSSPATGIAEKLNSLSPVVRQPAYVSRVVDIADSLCKAQNSVLLDAGTYPLRTIYLKLFSRWNKSIGYLSAPEDFAVTASIIQPDFILGVSNNKRLDRFLDWQTDTLRLGQVRLSYIPVLKVEEYIFYQRQVPVAPLPINPSSRQ